MQHVLRDRRKCAVYHRSVSHLCSVSLRYFSRSAALRRSKGFKPSLQVFTFWLSTYTSYRSFFSSKIFSVVPESKTQEQKEFNWKLFYGTVNNQNRKKKPQQLTSNVGELIFQGVDVSHVDVEEGAELGYDHAYPGDGDVCQATAAVHWKEGQGGTNSKKWKPQTQHGLDEQSKSALTSPASCSSVEHRVEARALQSKM